MADDEERAKAEKLAAAKKRVAQLQKQKKKAASKKSTASSEAQAPKDAELPKDAIAPVPAESVPEVEAENAVTVAAVAATSGEGTGTAIEGETKDPAAKQLAAEAVQSPVEPVPEAPMSTETEKEMDHSEATSDSKPVSARPSHARQPSLSVQSKLRSSSFSQNAIAQPRGSPSPTAVVKSPSLPPLSADGESVHEIFQNQVARIGELEKENRRLEKEMEELEGRRRKMEEQLEDLRETNVDVVDLRNKLEKAEQKAAEVDALKAEIAALQRQNSHLSSRSHRAAASVSHPGPPESPPAEIVQQLESKSATIEAMELEISNLRAQLASSSTHLSQIASLEKKLSQTSSTLEKTQRELADAKHSLTRAAEKAIKEGVDKTSTETLIKNLERELEESKREKADAEKKIDTLEKKVQTLGNLHKESETRHQMRLRESTKIEKEVAVLKKKLASVENENLLLREERERTRKRDASGTAGGADDDALDDLEDEERTRLQRRIRDLEGEVFELRRGAWKERRSEMTVEGEGDLDPIADSATNANANAFDDIDLVGGAPDHSRRRSLAHQQQQQHSSFTTVLSSGLAAFTGNNNSYGNRARAGSHQSGHGYPLATRGSLELLSEENLDDEFNEAEFARARAEEEAQQRVLWAREVKRKLRDWNGWRLDLVDSRAGAEGAGVGMGEIFEV